MLRTLFNLFKNKDSEEYIALKNEFLEKLPRLKEKLAKDAVQLIKTGKKCNSKIGGYPSVKAEFEWPIADSRPMTFLAQIDLKELPESTALEWLPNNGTLLFFYDTTAEPWGFSPKDNKYWKVIYIDSDQEHLAENINIKPKDTINEAFVEFNILDSYPPSEHPDFELFNFNKEEFDIYLAQEENDVQNFPNHQIAGYSRPIQHGHMELEAQLTSNGIDLGGSGGFEPEKEKELAPGSKKWKLLLQLDSDDDLELMWGDYGTIYFWVEEGKARNNNFDNVWLILQCC